MKGVFDPESIQVTIYSGENDFSMSRGNFNYKTRCSRKFRLTKMEAKESERGFIVYYGDGSKVYGHIRWEQISDSIQRALFSWDTFDGKYNRFEVTFPSTKEERFSGCGENYLKTNLKGEKVRIWVAEHQNGVRIAKKMLQWKASNILLGHESYKISKFSEYESYYSQPTFQSSRKYFIHVLTDKYSVFDFSKRDSFTLTVEDKPCIYIGVAEDYEELAKLQYKFLRDISQRDLMNVWPMSIRSLTSNLSMSVPKWVNNGAILAVSGGTEEVQKRIDEFKRYGGRIAAIWSQDWCGCRETEFGYQVMWDWKWNSDLYPRLHRKISEWQDEGIRLLGYINPFLALEGELYQEAKRKGYCVMDEAGKPYMVKITTFPAAMVDFTNPEAYKWFKQIIKENLIDLGLGGWMADFGEYLPTDCVLYSGEDPKALHNLWPAIWAGLNLEAIKEAECEEEVFFFTRAGSTGTIAKSSMMWTGYQHVDWSIDEGISSVIPATFSLAASGYPVVHSDAGGYMTIFEMTRSRELLMRWMEMNVFSPLFRTHEGNQPLKNVQFYSDEEMVWFTARASRLHEAWKEYINANVDIAKKEGIPVMRPLYYYYEDREAYSCQTEYLLGRDVLVAPILREGVLYRYVYFPSDEWIDVWTGQVFRKGYKKVSAPFGVPPVFVRKSSPIKNKLISKIQKVDKEYQELHRMLFK